MAPVEEEAGHGICAAGEWRVDVAAAGGEHENANTKSGAWHRACWAAMVAAPRNRVAGFSRMVLKVGAEDPRRVVHGFKVGLALTLCSLFYYVRPLYLFAGENNAMWAILTVVVVFEYTVGGCLYKGLNRAMATITGGGLALGVHWIAGNTGKQFQPYVLTASLFIIAALATFSRFIPTMKAKFDYGVTVFILTYCLVSVSGYRAHEVLLMAQQRVTTIAIGAFICFSVCVLIFPVWAGQELHVLAARNMENLATAVEGCVEDYFSDHGGEKPARRSLSVNSNAYKLVLNAKASEDSLANLAKWEPGHGKLRFRHPYCQYQKIGAAMRYCAYCIDALAACVGSEEYSQTPAHVRKHLAGTCLALSRNFAAVLREASSCVSSMTRSDRLALLVADMNAAMQELRDELRCLATSLQEEDDDDEEQEYEQVNAAMKNNLLSSDVAASPLIEVLPVFSAASLLLEVCVRAERVVGFVETLAIEARFKKTDHHEKTTLDEVPVSMDDAQETHASQENTEMKANTNSDDGPRDQIGKLMKVLMRRQSNKKVTTPKQPLDFAVHLPSPRNRALELVGHKTVVASSPGNRLVEFTPAAPSPRNRSMDNHGAVVPSPRHRSMEFAAHAPSPRNRSILGMAHA